MFKMIDVLKQASKDAIRSLVWANGQNHIAVANPAAASFAWAQAQAREELAQAEMPEQKKITATKVAMVKEETSALDVRFVIGLLLQARKSFEERLAQQLERAVELTENARAQVARVFSSIKGSGCARTLLSLATIVAKRVNVLQAREEEALAQYLAFCQG